MFREGSFLAIERRRAVPVLVVPVPEVGLQLPTPCAGCMEPAAYTVALERRGRGLLVPYCSSCRAAIARGVSFRLSAVVAALVLAVTWLLVLPRLWSTLSLAPYLLVVAGVAALPAILATVVGPAARQAQGGAATPAVWWSGPGQLACVTRGWAEELAALNQSHVEDGGRRLPPAPWLMLFAAPLLSLAVAPTAYAFFFPAVVVLNLSAGSAALFVDGHHLGLVESTSLESPSAGLRVRLAVGQRAIELRTLSEDRAVGAQRVQVEPGGQYLYAPASEGYCFWLEYDGYGREVREQRRVPLSADSEFWRLPERIDTWFASNPGSTGDVRSSGGTMLALRHARCERTGTDKPPADH